MMHRSLFAIVLLSVLVGCRTADSNIAAEHKNAAERFFRGVYGGDPSVVSHLAASDIVVSYPIFQTLFNAPVLEGHEAVEGFVKRFAGKWEDPEITIDEVVAEGDTVVLVWSFRARDALFEPSIDTTASPGKSWGGISVFRFNREGKIESEVGEESEPGPSARISTTDTAE